MGFDPDLFVEQPVDDNHVCSICFDVMDKPTSVCEAGHSFCAECVKGLEPNSSECPECRATISSKLLCRPFMSVINALQVRCPATRAQLKQDEADATEDVSTLCNAVANRCDWQGTLGDFVEKHRDHECPLRKVKCPLGCPAMIFACDVETHTQKECPSRPVSSWAVKKPPPAENNKERAIFSTVNAKRTRQEVMQAPQYKNQTFRFDRQAAALDMDSFAASRATLTSNVLDRGPPLVVYGTFEGVARNPLATRRQNERDSKTRSGFHSLDEPSSSSGGPRRESIFGGRTWSDIDSSDRRRRRRRDSGRQDARADEDLGSVARPPTKFRIANPLDVAMIRSSILERSQATKKEDEKKKRKRSFTTVNVKKKRKGTRIGIGGPIGPSSDPTDDNPIEDSDSDVEMVPKRSGLAKMDTGRTTSVHRNPHAKSQPDSTQRTSRSHRRESTTTIQGSDSDSDSFGEIFGTRIRSVRKTAEGFQPNRFARRKSRPRVDTKRDGKDEDEIRTTDIFGTRISSSRTTEGIQPNPLPRRKSRPRVAIKRDGKDEDEIRTTAENRTRDLPEFDITELAAIPRNRTSTKSKALDAVRIAIGKKVFANRCSIIYRRTSRKGRLFLCYDDKSGANVRHEIILDDASVLEIKYHLAEGPSDSESETTSFLAMQVEQNDANGLSRFPNAYKPCSMDAPASKRYIAIQFFSDGQFLSLIRAFMKDEMLSAFVGESSELKSFEVEEYGSSLLEAARKERAARERERE